MTMQRTQASDLRAGLRSHRGTFLLNETPEMQMDARRMIAPGQGVLLDIEAELEYWRRIFPTTEFREASLPFDDYVPTIKFGYDCFLLFHRQALAEILPGLRDRYTRTIARHQQLDWRWADQIVRHAWGRMRAT